MEHQHLYNRLLTFQFQKLECYKFSLGKAVLSKKFIRLVFPELTEDRRKELAKDVKKKGDNAKVAVRNVRRDANDAFKKQNKAGEISDDELKGTEDDIQKLTDKYTALIDKAVENKTKEILTV